MNPGGFHQSMDSLAIQQGGVAAWVTKKVPKRVVDYRFFVHYHPYTDELIQKLTREGLAAFLDVNYHATLHQDLHPNLYKAGPHAAANFPRHEIDVSDDGAYSVYNWELFFHAPLAIACHLSKNQRFDEAQRWFHYIFDPTSTDMSVEPPTRFWKFLRFRQETETEFIGELLRALAEPGTSELKSRIEKAITTWRDHPFQPHVVARTRYLAYQLNVVMKYLDNLIAWGDSLFRQDTIETLNEATQVYVLAADILGRKRRRSRPAGRSLREITSSSRPRALTRSATRWWKPKTNFLSPSAARAADRPAPDRGGVRHRPLALLLHSAERPARRLLGQGADRLFKIRHCMNIEGVVRQLALFDPPIDPGMLVRAVAAGIDIASIVNNINQPLSTVRGPMLVQRALELCAEVKSLGSALLSAIEKGDNEHLSMLRQEHELAMLNRARDVRFLQWKEAEAATESLIKSRTTVWERYRHYKKVLGMSDGDIDKLKTVDLARTALTEETFDSVYADWVGRYTQPMAREAYRKETSVGGLMEFAGSSVVSVFGGTLGDTLPLNKNENAELNIFLPTSDTFGTASTILSIASAALGLIPQFNAHGTRLGVGAAVGFGGVQLSKFAKCGAEGTKMIADAFRSSAERASSLPAITGAQRTMCCRPTWPHPSSSSTAGRSSPPSCASRMRSGTSRTTRSRSKTPKPCRSSCGRSSRTKSCTRGCRASSRTPTSIATSSPSIWPSAPSRRSSTN